MATQVVTFAGFLVLQVTFGLVEHFVHGRLAGRHYVVWLAHPAVIHSLHDWGIFLVGEMHLFMH